MDFNLDTLVNDFSKSSKPPDYFDFDASLNLVSTELAESPVNILKEDVFDNLQQLIYYIPDAKNSKKLPSIFLNLIHSLDEENRIIENAGVDIDSQEHKLILHYYIYFVYIAVEHLTDLFIVDDKIKNNRNKNKDKNSESEQEKKRLLRLNDILGALLSSLFNLLSLQLSIVFQGEQALSDFCRIVLTSVNTILTSKSNALKEKNNRTMLINIFCILSKNYQQSEQVSFRLKHALIFSDDTLFDVIAEVVTNSLKNYDDKKLLQEVLSALYDALNNSIDQTHIGRNMSNFLIKLSENLGPDIITSIDYFAKFSNFTPTRPATMICFANCIASLSKSEELTTKYYDTINSKIDEIEKYLLDFHFSVRQKCFQSLQIILSVENSHIVFNEMRYDWAQYCVRHLEDKSSFVRRAAIDLIKCILLNHPFKIHSGRLSWSYFWTNYVTSTQQLKEIDNGVSYNEIRTGELHDTISMILQNDEKLPSYKETFEQVLGQIGSDETESETKRAEIEHLKMKRKYCRDACAFIKIFDNAFEQATNLLISKTKTDVLSAVDFITMGDAFGIESSKEGVKQMLHLVWKSGSNDDNNKIVEKVVDSYTTMFLTANEGDSADQKNAYVANELINLTYGCSIADLISLEKLILELYRGKLADESKKSINQKDHVPKYIPLITPQIVAKVWDRFINASKKKEKKGAIIILSMLALADHKIVHKKIDVLIKYGLDLDGINYNIAAYTCITIRRSIPAKIPNNYTYPKYDTAIQQLKKILLINTSDGDWYNLATEALNTLYDIDENANDSATEVLKLKALHVFNDNEETITDSDNILSFSQLLFLLGHIGLKIIIYLEKVEADFKRQKQESENNKDEHELELDMIGGTSEDDFSDIIQGIKETKILYDSTSILGRFVPIIIEILRNPKKYNDHTLQRQAALCFAKFMCISSRFCEEHSLFYIELMKRSKDPIVRSNLVLGLGDIHVCFSNIVDENRGALYDRLLDKDIYVQRTCLMTITFLILAGQIKVRGQLSQLAKLLVHDDESLKEMSKLFFQELATKDNAIYNGFIDMLSGLNLYLDDPNSKHKQLPMNDFKSIIKIVLPFINKEKQRYHLVKSLYAKLKTSSPEIKLRYAFCLKELIKRDDLGKKDAENEKTKFYSEVLNDVNSVSTDDML